VNRILILIKGLGRGGAEQLLASAAAHLDRSRFRYEVAYLLPAKDALAAELARHGIEVTCLDGQGPAWLRRLGALIRERRIDLIHAHLPYAAIGARVALAGRRRPRLVYTEHNVWPSYRLPTYWANLVTFPRNDHVFAVSDQVRASIRYPRPLGWLRHPPVETLYHGLDPAAVRAPSPDGVREELGIDPGAPLVGTVANFRAEKAHGDLLRAAVLVRQAVPGVRFVLVGQGPLEGQVRLQAERLGLKDTVVFAGFREDASRVAAALDVFALSSRHEGLSIALMEAMALGKPSVVTSVGGLPELVEHDRQGLLVPPGDPAALAAGITTVLGDSALQQRLGQAARRRTADFDIRTAIQRMENVYGELLA
jgi:glycosyltransferase involved in cell wall biosynthesis